MRLIFRTFLRTPLENALQCARGVFLILILRRRDSTLRMSFLMGFTITCVLVLTGKSFAVSASASVKKGNTLYHQGKYDEALKYYHEAEVEMPDSDLVNFNTGTALYRKGDYEKAIKAFSKALLSDNPDIEAKAAYNIGNSKFRLGKLKENTDLASAINLYREALDYYKRAIELNQDDTNAKYNHEFVEKELKVLLDKLKQQQEKDQKGVQQNQEQKQQEQKQRGAEQGEEKQEQQKGESLKPAESPKPQQHQQKEMSEEEARMILDRYNQQDRPLGNLNRGARKRYYPPVLKDW